MEFTKKTLEPFGEELLAVEIETNLSYKVPLIFRFSRLLQHKEYISPAMRQLAELCFDEALTNAMVHGNRMDPNKKVRAWLFCDDERWGAIIEDEGEGFRPEDVPELGAEDVLLEAGRGVLLMDGYLDSLLYSNGGRRVMMVRHRERAEEAAPAVQEAAAPVTKEEPAPAPVQESAPVAGQQADLELLELEEAEVGRAIKVTREGDVAVIEILDTRLSDVNVDTLRAEVEATVVDSKSLVFDMARVNYISSAILGAFAAFAKLVMPKGGRIKVCRVHPVVMTVFKSMRFERLVDPQPDVQAALDKLRQGS